MKVFVLFHWDYEHPHPMLHYIVIAAIAYAVIGFIVAGLFWIATGKSPRPRHPISSLTGFLMIWFLWPFFILVGIP